MHIRKKKTFTTWSPLVSVKEKFILLSTKRTISRWNFRKYLFNQHSTVTGYWVLMTVPAQPKPVCWRSRIDCIDEIANAHQCNFLPVMARRRRRWQLVTWAPRSDDTDQRTPENRIESIGHITYHLVCDVLLFFIIIIIFPSSSSIWHAHLWWPCLARFSHSKNVAHIFPADQASTRATKDVPNEWDTRVLIAVCFFLYKWLYNGFATYDIMAGLDRSNFASSFIFLGLGLHFHPWASLWANAHTTSNSTRTPYLRIVRSFSNNYSKQRSCGIQYRIRMICTYIPFFSSVFRFRNDLLPVFSLSFLFCFNGLRIMLKSTHWAAAGCV